MDWSKFDFKFRVDEKGLSRYIVQIEAYKEAALNLVLPPQWSQQLDKLNRVRAVYGTTALEGNPLSEAEVSVQLDILEDPKKDTHDRVTKEQTQIRNSGTAQHWTRIRFSPENPPMSLKDILHLHRLLTTDSDTKDNIPGQLRAWEVTVGSEDMGGVHRGAPGKDVERLMNEYLEFINHRKFRDSNPVIHALLAHFFLVTIHPFGDGNGRVSRLVEAGILFQHKYNVHGFYGLSNYFYRNEATYKTLLQRCRRSQPFDVSAFVEFGLAGFAAELKGINNFIKTKLNRIVYRQMLVNAFNSRVGDRRRVINQREYNLLEFLLDATEPTDPFSANPSRRVLFSELRESKYIASSRHGHFIGS